MEDLIAKLESASEGSRALDADVAETQGWSSDADDNWTGPGGVVPPHYTTSLDAAMSLVPEGWNWHGHEWANYPGEDAPHSRMCITRGSLYSWLWVERPGDGHTGEAKTAALALCIAALKARHAAAAENAA